MLLTTNLITFLFVIMKTNNKMTSLKNFVRSLNETKSNTYNDNDNDEQYTKNTHQYVYIVINTLISTIFAISIVMSQALMYVDSSFWYLDPVLSIILALFMMAFGLKVLHQNLNILKPIVQQSNYYYSSFRSPQNSRRHNGDNLDRSSINIINSSEANIYKELDIKNKLNYGTNSGERNNKSWQGAQYPVVAIV